MYEPGSRNIPVQAPRGRPPTSRTGNPECKKPQTGGRVYCIEAQDTMDYDPHDVVAGTFPVNALYTLILFDAGATHSFINPATAMRLACHLNEMSVQLSVVTPVGSVYLTEYIV